MLINATLSTPNGISSPVILAEDTAFYTNLGTGFQSTIFSTFTDNVNKLVVGGDFLSLNGTSRKSLVKLNTDGTVDTAFYANLGTAFNATILSIARQSDEKIVAGGNFTNLDGNTRNRMVRLNSDGTEDTSFYSNLGTGFGGTVEIIKIQSDGKILVGGGFTTLNGTTRNYLVRLNTDGTVDTAFYGNLGTGFNDTVLAIQVLASGKILVGGNFTTFNGSSRNRILRLNADGTEDTSFYTNIPTGANFGVNAFAEQSDNKILVGGSFLLFGNVSRNRIVRLNADGTEDTAFYTALGSAANNQVQNITIQSNGKLLVGGAFTSFNGVSAGKLVRLNSDGTPDTAFNTFIGTGFNASIYWFTQVSNVLYISGGYSDWNGLTRQKLIKLTE